MLGSKYSPVSVNFSVWITFAQALEAIEQGMDSTSETIEELKKILISTANLKVSDFQVHDAPGNRAFELFSKVVDWNFDVRDDIVLDNDEFFNSKLTSDLKYLISVKDLKREEIFNPLKELISAYIEFPINEVSGDISKQETLLLVLGIALATIRDDSSADSKRNKQLRRDIACYWYARIVIDWIHNFGDQEYLIENKETVASRIPEPILNPFNPLTW